MITKEIDRTDNCINEYLVSIIIPTYNCEEYLDETLSSVLYQMPESCELIIVDDGSEDSTVSMLEKYVRDGARMRVSYENHSGASGARNKGLQMAKGRYITFMDCDDCQCEGFFDKSIPLTESDADLYLFGFFRVENAGRPGLEEIHPLLLEDKTYTSVSDFADDFLRGRTLLIYSNCNKFYRRRIIEEQSIRFREGMVFGEDRMFNYDYLKYCSSVVTSSIAKFNYMQRSDSSMSNRAYSGFLKNIMSLHKAKLDCFFELSDGTSEHEKRAYAGSDLKKEVASAVERLENHPEETDESLEVIREILREGHGNEDLLSPDWYKNPDSKQIVLDEIYRIGYEKAGNYTLI